MKLISARRLRLPLAILGSTLLLACSDSSDNNGAAPPVEPPIEPPQPGLTYQADIVWTEYGIPHVTAQDWGSLGYGYAYAYARDNYCTVMRAYVEAVGESARFFGDAGGGDANLISAVPGDLNRDLNMKLLNRDEIIAGFREELPDYIIDLLTGYAAGLNRYLADTGVDSLAEGEEGCRGAQWVRDVDLDDVLRLFHMTILRASALPLVNYTVDAQPSEQVAKVQPLAPREAEQLLATMDREALAALNPLPSPEQLGSNAYAIGEQASQSSSGLLFGNPHFPWQGQLRFFMSHLTMGDEYEAMGASLHGVPGVLIGFTRNLAWSHTVSTGTRFTFYELELNPENPLEYVYGEEMRSFEPRTVTAELQLEDGSLETVEHTFYLSHYGPVIDLGSAQSLLGGWPNVFGTVLTYRDANFGNLRSLDQWYRMGQSADLGEFKENLRTLGIPWVNTIAADRNGDAFYGDISVNPHVTQVQYDQCVRGPLQSAVTSAFVLTMDGSDPDCEWGSDADTPNGIFGYASLPKLETREYGANANDSYWLANPRTLLEGYPPAIGRERTERSLRTRATFDQAEQRLAGTDGLGDPGFNIDNLRQLHYQATNYTGELVTDDVVAVCSAVEDWSPYTDDGATVAQACSVLEAWDRTHLKDSVGAHVFWEFWQRVRGTPDLWAVPFDAADPVNTPRELNTANSAVVEAVRQALADGVARLVEAGIPMDRPWGEVQFDEKNGGSFGIHGGSSSMMFSVITSELVDGEGYSNITHGNSYIQAVTWDESDCPDAYAILTYSQSTDPASDHYDDATELYANGGWIDMPFCEADRDAQEIRRETVQE